MPLGAAGEALAYAYLSRRGYRIVERNYRNRFGEIDIIALHKGTVVFVEVKARRSDDFGQPFEAVTRKKREKLKKVALAYLTGLGREVPARFDVVSIRYGGAAPGVELITDAIEI